MRCWPITSALWRSACAHAVSFGAVVPVQEGVHVLLARPGVDHGRDAAGAHDLSGESDRRWVGSCCPARPMRTESRAGRLGPDRGPAHRSSRRRRRRWQASRWWAERRRQARTAKPACHRTDFICPEGGCATSCTHAPDRLRSQNRRRSPRPPGYWSTPDGADYQLDRSYVIGRAPLTDDEVRNATASPIVLQYDPYVSRVHAYITVDRGARLHPRRIDQRRTFIAGARRNGMDPDRHNASEARPGWSMRSANGSRLTGRRPGSTRSEGSAVNALQSLRAAPPAPRGSPVPSWARHSWPRRRRRMVTETSRADYTALGQHQSSVRRHGRTIDDDDFVGR